MLSHIFFYRWNYAELSYFLAWIGLSRKLVTQQTLEKRQRLEAARIAAASQGAEPSVAATEVTGDAQVGFLFDYCQIVAGSDCCWNIAY